MPHTQKLELEMLCRLFCETTDQLGRFEPVDADRLSQSARQLLAHDHHMTVAVEQFHNSSVDVQVLAVRANTDYYCRKIILTRQSDGVPVLFGIVRVVRSALPAEVVAEIEAQQTPLGRILIAHHLLRDVKWLQLFCIAPERELSEALKLPPASDCAGRTAMITCDGQPAIELLEVVPSSPR